MMTERKRMMSAKFISNSSLGNINGKINNLSNDIANQYGITDSFMKNSEKSYQLTKPAFSIKLDDL